MRVKDYIKRLDELAKERQQISAAMLRMEYSTNSRAYKVLAEEHTTIATEMDAIRNKEVDTEEVPYDPQEEEDDE